MRKFPTAELSKSPSAEFWPFPHTVTTVTYEWQAGPKSVSLKFFGKPSYDRMLFESLASGFTQEAMTCPAKCFWFGESICVFVKVFDHLPDFRFLGLSVRSTDHVISHLLIDLRLCVKTHMLNSIVNNALRSMILGHSQQKMDVHYLLLTEENLLKPMDRYTEWLGRELGAVCWQV